MDTSRFENVKDRLYAMLEANPDFTPEQKQKIHDYIAAAPDADTAIHGDLQFGNGIFIPSGEKYFIDLGDFCYGFPLFDLGMVYLCCCLNDEAWTMEVNHMSNATARRFWDAFAEAYFHAPDCPLIPYGFKDKDGKPLFGPGADLQQVEDLVKIYAGLKTLIVERDTHCPMPQFRAMLEGTIY